MAAEWRYRGRVVTADELTFIRQLIAENPGASRRRLSEKLCEAWQWKQANGALRDMVCRGLLLMLHRAGEIELPPIRFQTLNPFVRRATPAPMLIDMTPIAGALKQLQPIQLQRSTAAQHPLHRLQHTIPDLAVGTSRAPGVAYPGPHGGADLR